MPEVVVGSLWSPAIRCPSGSSWVALLTSPVGVGHPVDAGALDPLHTNTIEGSWSLMKRRIDGVYHAVSEKHLRGYLNEYAWRYNHRHDDEAMFLTLLDKAAESGRNLLLCGSLGGLVVDLH
jgi:hypothetical protein